MALKVRCQNSERKCDWTGELVDLLKVNRHFCIGIRMLKFPPITSLSRRFSGNHQIPF